MHKVAVLTLDASHAEVGCEAQGKEAEGRLNYCQRGRLGKWAQRRSRGRSDGTRERGQKGCLRSFCSAKLGARHGHSSLDHYSNRL